MKTKNPKRWFGTDPATENCDICQEPILEESEFYDAIFKIPNSKHKTWGLLCQSCYFHHAFGLGVGLGQSYSSTPPYLKTGG